MAFANKHHFLSTTLRARITQSKIEFPLAEAVVLDHALVRKVANALRFKEASETTQEEARRLLEGPAHELIEALSRSGISADERSALMATFSLEVAKNILGLEDNHPFNQLFESIQASSNRLPRRYRTELNNEQGGVPAVNLEVAASGYRLPTADDLDRLSTRASNGILLNDLKLGAAIYTYHEFLRCLGIGVGTANELIEFQNSLRVTAPEGIANV